MPSRDNFNICEKSFFGQWLWHNVVLFSNHSDKKLLKSSSDCIHNFYLERWHVLMWWFWVFWPIPRKQRTCFWSEGNVRTFSKNKNMHAKSGSNHQSNMILLSNSQKKGQDHIFFPLSDSHFFKKMAGHWFVACGLWHNVVLFPDLPWRKLLKLTHNCIPDFYLESAHAWMWRFPVILAKTAHCGAQPREFLHDANARSGHLAGKRHCPTSTGPMWTLLISFCPMTVVFSTVAFPTTLWGTWDAQLDRTERC